MPTVRGRGEVDAYFAKLPIDLTKVLRGAARAAATVVADEAKARSRSTEVAEAVKVATKQEDDRVIAKVQVKGKGAYIAPWLEYGTSPHFISVDESQRMGMSIGRINQMHKAGSLVINGQFVGATVHHPGATPHPFLRPALDTKEAEAVAQAQRYINSRIARGRVTAAPEVDEQ
ncbi:HK97 gp10 family phage protein [Sphingomonas ginkgonis]|nr:HK97 gp10 family phage protein [Sphingomonas ginkgonis]